MATIIDMPKLSDTMTVGTLVKWLKKEGDTVASGDMIAEVETDKATMELENFEDGVLIKQYAKEGEQVPIGSPIAAVGEKDEAAPEVEKSEKSSGVENKDKKTNKEDSEGDRESKSAQAADKIAEPSKESAPVAKEAKVSTVSSVGSVSNSHIKASPLARKVARSLGIALRAIRGSGPEGRIVKSDVLAAEAAGASAASVGGEFIPTGPVEDKVIPVSNMRRAIATHLVASKTQIPHFYLDIEVDAEPLVKMRAALNKKYADLPPEEGGIKFTVNDFILKATVQALRDVPAVNASWTDEQIIQYGAVNIAFGVAVPDGLVTPVINNAQAKSLRQISTEAKELIGKARNKKLSPQEMQGFTFTVTNLGMYGINRFYGIVNPPNAGILSVGATQKKPVVSDEGQIVTGYLMNIGFSGDHRVVDGAAGAEFLVALKECIENPGLMLA